MADWKPGVETSRLAFAHKRKDVHALNQAIRLAIQKSNRAARQYTGDPDTNAEIMFETNTGPCAFTSGDRIVFTRNDKSVGVKNGTLGTVKSVGKDQISVMLDNDTSAHKPRQVSFDLRLYTAFDHGYAVTIHKSQGATVD